MPIKEISELKEKKQQHDKEVRSFNKDLKKHKEKPQKAIVQSNDVAKGINYYNSLSEGEKAIFQKELKKKEELIYLLNI